MVEFIPIRNQDHILRLYGNLDENIMHLESTLDIRVILRDGYLEITGSKESVKIGALVIRELLEKVKLGAHIDLRYIDRLVDEYTENPYVNFDKNNEPVVYTAKGKPIRPLTPGQAGYIDTIEKNEITFGIGPAGTGKTFLAVAKAVKAFKEQEVSRIVLTRPAVEAGESLGFLPGDLQMKVDPYLRPLYDGIFEILGADTFHKLLEKDIIEVAPLAYMRGRTLDNSYIILDEAQNTTSEQMKMFLTRIGNGSKAIVTGDITQVDLKSNQKSGLVDVQTRLKSIEGIGFCYLDKKDVVRHSIVQKIIEAYENND